MEQCKKEKSLWTWIPSLYFGEGLPYVAVMTLAGIMYKNLGLSNTDIALYTGWLNLPWAFKALWSPFVDVLHTKRWWILLMQFVIGVALAVVAFSIPTTYWFQMSFALLFLVAFSSATHDIAADGFYLLALTPSSQAAFVGIRNTFWRIAMITGQGGLVVLAGRWEKLLGNRQLAWSYIFYITAVAMILLCVYHFFVLPKSITDKEQQQQKIGDIFRAYGRAVESFITKMPLRQLFAAVFFILFYRFAEAQLTAIGKLFMLDPVSKGGLGLNTEQVGILYGTVGVVALLLGGICGGLAIAHKGLKYCLLPMAMAISLPDLVYVYFACFQPDNFLLINICIFIEQFGYGFGFASFMMYLMYISEGKFKTAHYAFCTALMALGMTFPSMIAGKLQEMMGYRHFFVWVMLCTVLTFIAVALIKIESNFGKKTQRD